MTNDREVRIKATLVIEIILGLSLFTCFYCLKKVVVGVFLVIFIIGAVSWGVMVTISLLILREVTRD